MQQKINLYKESKITGGYISFLMIMQVIGAFIILSVIFILYLLYNQIQARSQINYLNQQQEVIEKKIKTTKGEIPTVEENKKVEQKIQELNQIRDKQILILSNLSKVKNQNQNFFSEYMQALINSSNKNIAVSKIEILDNGNIVYLSGEVKDSRFLPGWLQKLGKSPAFKNINFDKLILVKNPDIDKPWVNFQLSVDSSPIIKPAVSNGIS